MSKQPHPDNQRHVQRDYAEHTMRSVRLTLAQLDEIDQRAKHAGMSRNAYMIRAALGELDDPSAMDERLNDLVDRVKRLEHYQGLGA